MASAQELGVIKLGLKDRKGRTFSDEDIQHYQRIVVERPSARTG
jgi:hypothetical protein